MEINPKPPESDVEQKKKRVKEEKDYYSTQVSHLLRVTNLGLLGVIWTLFMAKDPVAGLAKTILSFSGGTVLKFAMFVIVITLLLDFLQYLAGYRYQKLVYDKLESGKHTGGRLYDKSHPLWKLQGWCFAAKIVSTVLGVVIVLVVLVGVILGA